MRASNVSIDVLCRCCTCCLPYSRMQVETSNSLTKLADQRYEGKLLITEHCVIPHSRADVPAVPDVKLTSGLTFATYLWLLGLREGQRTENQGRSGENSSTYSFNG